MFRNRTTSQKPSDDLYRSFKASFPQLGPNGSPPASEEQGATSLTDALDVANIRPFGDHQDMKDADPTPKGSNDPWNFASSGSTPSFLDPNSHSFNAFANQMPGYYTPTPGGTNTLYHSSAGDLHTPGFSMGGLGTPLSMPTSENALTNQQAGMHGFHPQMHAMHPMQFHNVNPFAMHQPQTFPPQNFQHQPPPLEHNDSGPTDDSPMDVSLDMDSSTHSPDVLFRSQSFATHMAPPPMHPSTEKFRYHTTLNAPTAMIKHSDEIPVTYLNKGQAYTSNVVDTAPQQSVVGQLKYRTFVRVSFEDEQQRQRPGACWQLWKEGRGTNEAHQRGGRSQAVEYVDPSQINAGDDPSRARIEVESASFDGFCVTWTPGASGNIDCQISVRFNFLSTDFSHSKGVKGIPVRSCAKTELLSDSMSPTSKAQPAHEICYCKVKLFRDHGAERKLSNDVAHVKKTIDKLNQQITQLESGMRDLGKRKRSGSISKAGGAQRPGKVPKHRRTWSMTSTSSTGGRTSSEEDLHIKLMTLQDMFGSTRPASVSFLRGSEEDDPDMHPVRLPGGVQDVTKIEPVDASVWDRQSVQTGASSIVSPTPSSQSLTSGGRRDSNFPRNTFGPPSRVSSNEWRGSGQTATMDLQSSNPQHLASPPDQPVKVQTHSPTSGTLSGWIETLGVDHSYQPPPERAIKPIACFFVQPRVAGKAPEDGYHRAIYLMQRSSKDFINAVATKCNIEPTHVIRTVRVSRKGLHVSMDDEAIREMPEGQDMTAEFTEIKQSTSVKPSREWDSGPTDIQVDGDINIIENMPSSGYELKSLY